MADFTITISNNLYAFGPDVITPSLWNGFDWGENWAYTATDLITEIEKNLSNAITPSDALFKDSDKFIDNQVTPSEEFSKSVERTIDNTLSPTADLSSETLQNGSWFYVFTRPSINAEDRTQASFTVNSNASTTWSSGTVTSSSWS